MFAGVCDRDFGRGGRVRTGDLLVPNQARFHCATPRASDDTGKGEQLQLLPYLWDV